MKLPKDSIVLLECMSNLTANEMFQKDGAGEHTVEEILEGVRSLQTQAKQLVIVTNEIFSDGISYDTETQRYESYLGEINQKIVGMADCAVEVVYGIPLFFKGNAEKFTEKKDR